MAEELEEYTGIEIDPTALRLENIKLPNGNTYKVGLSLEEQQSLVAALSDLNDNIVAVNDDVEDLKSSEKVVAASLNDLNSRIVALTEENAELRSAITLLTQEIQTIKNNYMAYYDVDPSAGIGENNVYNQ